MLHEPKLEHCRPFLASVDGYLIAGVGKPRRLSERIELRLMGQMAADDPNVVRAIAELDFETMRLQEAWQRVAASHADALAASF